MRTQPNFPVSNTLGLEALATQGVVATSIAELQEAITIAKALTLPVFAFGQGSNVIVNNTLDYFAIAVRNTGVELLEIQEYQRVCVRAAAGIEWHRFVEHCLNQGWYGLENLALIPGMVGATPIQNVGAYGVEVADVICGVHLLDSEGQALYLTQSQCDFSYRHSRFKSQPELIVTAVDFTLSLDPQVNTEYPDIAENLDTAKVVEPMPRDVFKAVCAIRRAKLPDVKQHPNVGSFFKNPVVETKVFHQLKQKYTQLLGYPQQTSQKVKMSAAQLLDLSGAKQLNSGSVVCWPKQPLVLVNKGGASIDEVLTFAETLATRVQQKFGVQLDIEPQLIGC